MDFDVDVFLKLLETACPSSVTDILIDPFVRRFDSISLIGDLEKYKKFEKAINKIKRRCDFHSGNFVKQVYNAMKSGYMEFRLLRSKIRDKVALNTHLYGQNLPLYNKDNAFVYLFVYEGAIEIINRILVTIN